MNLKAVNTHTARRLCQFAVVVENEQHFIQKIKYYGVISGGCNSVAGKILRDSGSRWINI